jgi:glutaredoxin
MKIDIYGMDNCTYCQSATQFCTAAGLDYNYIDLTKSPEQLDVLEERIGRFRTVPQIFINGEHVGGYTEFREAAKNGKG